MTAEQARIANHQLSQEKDEIIKIVAFAGTGKTTTLIQMCQNHPHLQFLVVVYNKSVQEHATEVFPKSNTKILTAHALAKRKVGWQYKGKKFSQNLKTQDLMHSDLISTDGIAAEGTVQCVLSYLRYENSNLFSR